ncbi:hypothetical protein [Bradyrhizobium sp. HKCCYLR20261]|uniref:hypothetical protein n=1 Tax=Bradyrhizobium sp. HKCCYLR20261 TaxID=3420760 RepID=UPI003EBB7308
MPDSNAGSFIGLGLTAAGFAFALYQYRMNSEEADRARRRERAVMAVEHMKNFYDDPNVKFAMQLLDHGRAHLEGVGEVAASELREALKQHWVDTRRGSEQEGTEKKAFNARDRAIRTAFDGFLVQLESIEHLIVNGVIGAREFGELFSYWLILLGETARPDDKIGHLSDDARSALWTYIRVYQFDAVVRLFARYGRAAPPGVEGGFVARGNAKIPLKQLF